MFDSVGSDDVQGRSRNGRIFSFSKVHNHPELVKKYRSVVPYNDNYFATLNSAVFSDGSFVHPQGALPDGVSTYFHQPEGHGAIRRTLIVAEEGAYVSYLEG